MYDRYPNKTGKLAAAQVFQEAAEASGGEAALAAAILARFDAGMLTRPPYDGGPRYSPSLERFLAERRWEDADQPAAPARADFQKTEDGRAYGYHHVSGKEDHYEGGEKWGVFRPEKKAEGS